MGAQLAGGVPRERNGWDASDSFMQVPFPDGFKNQDTRFELFLETLQPEGRASPNRSAA